MPQLRSDTRRRARGRQAAVPLVLALLVACAPADSETRAAAPPALHGTLVDDPPVARPALHLQDTSGQTVDLQDRPADEVTALFFGYTHCPDLCPTTMADLAAARAQLPPALRDQVQLVFVTEDPQRDTPPVLREWLDRFDPDILGLLGGGDRTSAALQELLLPKTTTVPEPETPVTHPHDTETAPHDHGDYGVDHAGPVWVFGPGGRSAVYTGGTTPTQYAEDFRALLGKAP